MLLLLNNVLRLLCSQIEFKINHLTNFSQEVSTFVEDKKSSSNEQGGDERLLLSWNGETPASKFYQKLKWEQLMQ